MGSLTPSQVTFDRANGAGFTIFGSSGAPTLISNKYIFFGKVEVVVQAAPGSGIITCVVLGSDCEDEIDWVRFSSPSPCKVSLDVQTATQWRT